MSLGGSISSNIGDFYNDCDKEIFYTFDIVKVREEYYLVMGYSINIKGNQTNPIYSYRKIDVNDFILNIGTTNGLK